MTEAEPEAPGCPPVGYGPFEWFWVGWRVTVDGGVDLVAVEGLFFKQEGDEPVECVAVGGEQLAGSLLGRRSLGGPDLAGFDRCRCHSLMLSDPPGLWSPRRWPSTR